jgi:hypothetical protein
MRIRCRQGQAWCLPSVFTGALPVHHELLKRNASVIWREFVGASGASPLHWSGCGYAAPGDFSMQVKNWKSGEAYEFRAVVKHPLLMLYGKEINLRVP